MRFLIPTLFGLICALSAKAGEFQFSNVVKASLIFRDESYVTRHYPHVLKVFLRLDNVHASNISWVADAAIGIEAELLDAEGKSVSQAPQFVSIQSNACAYLLPYGSRLDWLISHGGISFKGGDKDKYALIVGGRGWLIPIKTAGSYSLRISLRGLPWTNRLWDIPPSNLNLLLDLPPTKIQVAK